MTTTVKKEIGKKLEKEINEISFKLHLALVNNDLELFEKTLNEPISETIDDSSDKIDVRNLDHPSLNSLLLNYYISTKNKEKIEEIETRKLMKRDLITLSTYYFSKNKKKSEEYFDRIIFSKEILDKDIITFLNNGLCDFLPKLNGLYFQLPFRLKPDIKPDSKKINELVSELISDLISEFEEKQPKLEIKELPSSKYNLLSKFSIKPELRDYILELLLNKIPDVNKKHFYKFLSKTPYNIILDAGNIIHSVNRETSKEGVILLQTIIDKLLEDKSNDILVIIHQRHIKKYKELTEILKTDEKKLHYYETPYKQNDDWYQLIAFLMKICPIISRDKFRDHIFDYKSKNPNLDQFKFILHENTINYIPNKKGITFEKLPKYSECIQYSKDDEEIYLPVRLENKHLEIIKWIQIKC